MTPTIHLHRHRPTATAALDRILVGVDGTPPGFDACRQATCLAGPDAFIEAATVVQFVPGLAGDFEHAAVKSLAAARRILGSRARTQRLYGFVVPQLLDEAREKEATLLAIGTHGHPRIEEMVFGGVAGELLHQARCSVLLARPVPDIATFPRRIVVGLDGSEEAERAYAVAQVVARRRHSSLEGLAALGGKRVDLGRITYRHPWVRTSGRTAVAALVDAAASADLVVVGSRGLHGLRALGSVSERVAHRATCSVLVVRLEPEATS